MQKTLPFSCYGSLLAKDQDLELTGTCPFIFSLSSTHRELTRSIWQCLIYMSVEWSQGVHFHQIALLIVLFLGLSEHLIFDQ